MTDTNGAVGAEALEPVQVGGEVETPQPQENPEPELAPGAGGTEEAKPESQESAEQPDEGDKPKKKGGFQRTIEKKDADIEKLTRAKYEAELRAHAAERKLAEATRTESLDAEPGPEPKLEEFETVEAFTRSHAEWAKRQGYQQFKKESEERQHEQAKLTAQAALAARVDEARKRHADYDHIVAPISDFVDRHPVLSEYVMQSDMAPDVAYHLGKNPAALLDLAKLAPFQIQRELAKIEARLSAAPPPKPVTSAPAPIKPVGQSEKAPFSLETADMDTFVRKRNEEERKSRKG